MSRRALVVASLFLTVPAFAKRVEFIQEFHPAAQDQVELWIPTPVEGVSYQKLVSRELSGNATTVRVVSSGPAPFIHAKWSKVKDPTLKIVNVVEIADRTGAAPESGDPAEFLKASAHVQLDGIVKDTAAKITANAKDADGKARAVYDWIVDNTERDPNVRGCGIGDVKTMLESKNLRGKCADLNSLFVGLARASGVPAREVFGQRVANSTISKSLGKEGDNSKAQHCRAEYYSDAKKGWIPVDPADVRKFILEEKLAVTDPKVKDVREKFFGFWEGTWIAFNFARDFKLEGYEAERVNFFMYPLLAAAKIRPDGVEPQETGYQFQTTLLN